MLGDRRVAVIEVQLVTFSFSASRPENASRQPPSVVPIEQGSVDRVLIFQEVIFLLPAEWELG
jgi:hypothetical protein